jgi:hypothetical protein
VTTTAQREGLARTMQLLIDHESLCGYPDEDVRGPLDTATWQLSLLELTTALAKGVELTFDCSQSVTQICRYHGLKDPNGLAYQHAGYTGTMLDNRRLEHYTNPRDADVGALVVFGPGTGQHVAMVLEPGVDPWLFSHGAPKVCGPIRFSAEKLRHTPPATFLSITNL